MTIPARLRKTSDLVVYTKLTVLTALFIKEFKKCIIGSELRIQLDVVKDGMTASGYADFTSLSYNDIISIPVYHTN